VRDVQLAVGLAVKGGFLLFVAMIVGSVAWAVHVSHEHAAARSACRGSASARVVALHVRPVDAAYAHRQGWPIVLSRDMAVWSVPRLDSSRSARRVVARADGLCRGQRFRLVAS